MTAAPRSVQQLFDLKGKTALITGGSRGLGLQMAHALGEAGARVLVSSRKAEDLESATAELQAAREGHREAACAGFQDVVLLAGLQPQRCALERADSLFALLDTQARSRLELAAWAHRSGLADDRGEWR